MGNSQVSSLTNPLHWHTMRWEVQPDTRVSAAEPRIVDAQINVQVTLLTQVVTTRLH